MVENSSADAPEFTVIASIAEPIDVNAVPPFATGTAPVIFAVTSIVVFAIFAFVIAESSIEFVLIVLSHYTILFVYLVFL